MALLKTVRAALALATSASPVVAIDEPERVLASYPFQLSGGMNQRVMITSWRRTNRRALALADETGPRLM